ncbi:MAG: hypothetical protein ACOCWQ_04535 [Nanoarchaeota archaeon]
MRINFFEEYPDQNTLGRAQLIRWPATIFLAAESYTKYLDRVHQLQRINPDVTTGWWPILPVSTWISPFSKKKELNTLQKEMEKMPPGSMVLLDLELPLIRPTRFLAGLNGFFRKRRMIRNLFLQAQRQKIKIYTAEYPPILGRIGIQVFRHLGISYADNFPHTRIPMMYTSMLSSRSLIQHLRKHLQRRYYKTAGLGVTASGIMTRRAITKEELHDDLTFCVNHAFQEVFIYRLGGLTEDSVAQLERFARNQ